MGQLQKNGLQGQSFGPCGKLAFLFIAIFSVILLWGTRNLVNFIDMTAPWCFYFEKWKPVAEVAIIERKIEYPRDVASLNRTHQIQWHFKASKKSG